MSGKIIPWIPSNFGAQEKQEDDLVQLMAGAGESTGDLGNFYELSIPWRVLVGKSGNHPWILVHPLVTWELFIHYPVGKSSEWIFVSLLVWVYSQLSVFFSQLLFMNPIQCNFCGSKAPTSHPQTQCRGSPTVNFYGGHPASCNQHGNGKSLHWH